jgi:hypothetical protein
VKIVCYGYFDPGKFLYLHESDRLIYFMATLDILKTLEGVLKDTDKLGKLLDALDVLVADAKFVAYSHQTFLPIARKYIIHKGTANYQLQGARTRRARLGGASRWLYYHQKRTFEKTVQLIFPVPIPGAVMDRIWLQVRMTETRMLHRARAQYGS